MEWIDYKIKKPTKPGKYIVKTITPHKNVGRFDAKFNGNSFDVNNQIVTHWLNENNHG